MDEITYKDFVDKFNKKEIDIYVNENKAGDFVLSDFADKHNKPAHIFWSWVGILITIPLSIILLFIHWYYAIISFIVGVVILKASRKSACQFVTDNMLKDEKFWLYVLDHKGAIIKDKNGKEYNSLY